jgi:DnaJ-class molecular chaperone
MNFYEILEVSETATIQEIKRAYKKQCSVFHPDKGGGEEEFILLKKAYDTLIDPELRGQYDLTGTSSLDSDTSSKAVQLLVSFLAAAVAELNIETMDVYEQIRKRLVEMIANSEAKIDGLEKKIERQNKVASRTKNSPRIVAFHEGIVKEIRRQALGEKEVVAIHNEVLRLLKDVEYDMPEPPARAPTYPSTVTTATSSW